MSSCVLIKGMGDRLGIYKHKVKHPHSNELDLYACEIEVDAPWIKQHAFALCFNFESQFSKIKTKN